MVFLKRFLIIFIGLFVMFGIKELNASSDIYSEFSSIQTKTSLYISHGSIKYDSLNPNGKYDIKTINIKFGAVISKELYESLKVVDKNLKFGVAAARAERMEKDGKTLIDYAHDTDHFFTCPLRTVDSKWEADDNGDYYLITITITQIALRDIDSALTASCFVYVNDSTYLMKEISYSVRDIVKYYIETEANDYSEHLGVLNYIYSY